MPHVQHDYFCSFNQSDHCFLVSLLPLPSSLLTFPNNIGQGITSYESNVLHTQLKYIVLARLLFPITGRPDEPVYKCNYGSERSTHQFGQMHVSVRQHSCVSLADRPISSRPVLTVEKSSPRIVGSNSKFNPKKWNGKWEIKKCKKLLPKKSSQKYSASRIARHKNLKISRVTWSRGPKILEGG